MTNPINSPMSEPDERPSQQDEARASEQHVPAIVNADAVDETPAHETTPDSPSEAEAAPSAPAGWYDNPSGGRRYWNGSEWLDVPDPGGAVSTPARRARPRWSKKRVWITSGVATAVIIACLAGGLAWKLSSDAAAQEVAAAAEAKREADAKRIAENKRAAERAKAAEEQQERENRATSVTEIEASIKTMAEGHASDELIEGPVLDVSCSPVNGGSLDDLTDQTTVFDCFVANVDNGDGTMSGYGYNATMNWTTGSYTYSLGAP
ncbi:DUF2510 domain-containing protein [Agromyces sp. NPDC058484]|uniref:DUF2510 domain-containing protein n=1 Tax=Agromyces sp. NPDC058484 TaxID=3346524 RepID=UPI003662C02F